jgi:hypothetical protein
MVEVVAEDGDGLVEQAGGVGLGAALEHLGEQVGVVAAAGLDELLLRSGALDCGTVLARCLGRRGRAEKAKYVRRALRRSSWGW